MPADMAIFQGILFSSGPIPVLGSFGGVTTTVASEKSMAVKPLALPWAVPVFTVFAARFIRQVYVHVSEISSMLLLFTSPERPETGLHLLSTTLTLLKATVPGLVTVYV